MIKLNNKKITNVAKKTTFKMSQRLKRVPKKFQTLAKAANITKSKKTNPNKHFKFFLIHK